MNLATAQQQTVDLLIQHLAVMQAIASAERVYRTIFGSQIALLKSMNIRGGIASRDSLEAVYAVARSHFPALYETYGFQQWVNYLVSNNLISTNNNEQFSITVDGKEFLKWITDAAVIEDKPF